MKVTKRRSFARFGVVLAIYLLIAVTGLGMALVASMEPGLVKDINPAGPSGPDQFAGLDGKLFFRADDGTHGDELWLSDGTLSGTEMISDINILAGSSPYGMIALDGAVLFRAKDPAHGQELWKSDGTMEGTVLVKDIFTGTGDAIPFLRITWKDEVYLRATDGVHGNELWKTDGTPTGTIMLRDIYTGTTGANPQYMAAIDDYVLFDADDGVRGAELWRTDGTPSGTEMVKDIHPSGASGPKRMAEMDDIVYFSATDPVSGTELWRSNGTEAGTYIVKDINPAGDSNPQYPINVDGTLFFAADNGVLGKELWMSDGTKTGTVMVRDIYTDAQSSYPTDMIAMGGLVFFSAKTGALGYELWKSDGTKEGTLLVKDIYTNAGGGSGPTYFAVAGGTLFFQAQDYMHGREVWKSDGTEEGTVLVKNIRSGDSDSDPYDLAVIDGTLYFSAIDDAHGRELWALDGLVHNLWLERAPEGDLFTGNTVRFTAWAEGATPMTYTWTLNDLPAGVNSEIFEYTFESGGTYTVGVTVANGANQSHETTVVKVQEPAPSQPDLSPSYKTANRSTVGANDLVTYTIILRNASPITATATVTDPIPDHTIYVAGSAMASDGGPVALVDDELQWSGQVVSGTPVLIEFAAQVGVAPDGTVITNVAHVDDGLGNLNRFEMSSAYMPGYGLTINEGDSFTRIPTVTLRYSWLADDNITHVRFSNHRGFWKAAETSEWMVVNAGNPVYDEWVLDVGWFQFWPCRVYAEFLDGNGKVHGPFRDLIWFDHERPWIRFLRFFFGPTPPMAASVDAWNESVLTLHVEASDSNSGVEKVQVSQEADFGQYTEFQFTGPMMDIDWTPERSGTVYVRVVDRAGNISEASSLEVSLDSYVYLPVVLRNVP